MTDLLVSVRNVEEAAKAWRGGAAIIDIKEPRRGSLGAADPVVWRAVAEHFGRQVPISVALGELLDFVRLDRANRIPWEGLWEGISFVKIGLSRCGILADWQARWNGLWQSIPISVGRVAVIYADWHAAQTPNPLEILATSCELGCSTVLIDTFYKNGCSLLDVIGRQELADWCRTARSAGQRLVLAGSLRTELFADVLVYQPDLLAVRGAVCESDRNSSISEARVRELADHLQSIPDFNRSCLTLPD